MALINPSGVPLETKEEKIPEKESIVLQPIEEKRIEPITAKKKSRNTYQSLTISKENF
jgi:hypothetical protein